MAHYDYQQTKMIPLRLAGQLQPETFEFTLNHFVANNLNLSVFYLNRVIATETTGSLLLTQRRDGAEPMELTRKQWTLDEAAKWTLAVH